MLQLILHLWGDYIFQSTWMALNKSKRSLHCAIHCATYTLPFLIATRSWAALFVIFATHYLIDRNGLARYLVWIKEAQSPIGFLPWAWCSMTGYFDEEKAIAAMNAIKQADHDGRMRHVLEMAMQCYSDPNVNRPVWIRVWLTIVADNTLHLTFNYLALRFLTPAFDHWFWSFLAHPVLQILK